MPSQDTSQAFLAFRGTSLPVLVERVEFESLKKRIDKGKSIENI